MRIYLSMFVGIFIFAVGGAIVLAPAVHAEDTTATQQQEESREAAKKAAEEAAEAQKKEAERVYEARKDASEDVREAEKQDAEEEREGLKDALEREKEMQNASSTDDDDEDEERDKGEGERHMSAVARFIRSLDRIASSSPRGIGEQVREIAHEQGSTTRMTAEHIEKVVSRSAFVAFLIGANRESMSELERSVAAMQDSIDRLTKVQASVAADIGLSIGQEVQVLVKEKERVQAIIDANKDKAGIFGWLVNLLK